MCPDNHSFLLHVLEEGTWSLTLPLFWFHKHSVPEHWNGLWHPHPLSVILPFIFTGVCCRREAIRCHQVHIETNLSTLQACHSQPCLLSHCCCANFSLYSPFSPSLESDPFASHAFLLLSVTSHCRWRCLLPRFLKDKSADLYCTCSKNRE